MKDKLDKTIFSPETKQSTKNKIDSYFSKIETTFGNHQDGQISIKPVLQPQMSTFTQTSFLFTKFLR